MTLRRMPRAAVGVLGAVVAVALLITTLVVWPANAQDPPHAPPDAAPTGTTKTVTLITGDQVHTVNGQVTTVRMGDNRKHLRYWQYRINDHDYVVPHDAMPLLRRGRLDERLFDVTGLVDQGLDDASESDVEVIVEAAAGRSAPVPRVAQETTTIGDLGLTALATPKQDATAAWTELRSSVATRSAGGGKIWLNGRVRASLDQSVPQVGAPDAWDDGLTGADVPVAVLDTGYDTEHPDLESAVDKSANFTGMGSVDDKNGHGTHVASTIAGSGAASDGRFTGVAPDARLLVGKVLTDDGAGSEAWILDGMRWATEQGARVVNMSLGGAPTDGSDLLSTKLNELSESTGALFVVAAGNSGARETVGSPGAADRALTVGSVTKSDELSHFSSRGPRIGDYGLKPEITAPGTDIVAARADGTLDGGTLDEHYASLSGTSMATPHVAGAAAIVAGQHPRWTDEQIKNALVGSAKPLRDTSIHAQGAGRLDVATAVDQSVRADGVLGFGMVWDDGGNQRMERKVTYVNDGDRTARLRLNLDVRDADGRRAPKDLFTADKRRVVVAPGETATVTVSTPVSSEPAGEFSGTLRATGRGVSLTSPLTANLAGAKHTLTVRVQGRHDGPLDAIFVAQNEDTGIAEATFAQGGTAEFTLPAGRYRVLGQAQEGNGPEDEFANTLFAERTEVASDTSVVVDAKRGKLISASVDDEEARQEYGGGHAIVSDRDGSGPAPPAAVLAPGNLSEYNPLYSIGSQPMDGLSLTHFSYWTPPMADVTLHGPGGFSFERTYLLDPLGFTGPRSGELVNVGYADRESIDKAGDVRGKIALIAPPDLSNPQYPPGKQIRDGITLLAERGAVAVLLFFYPYDGAEEPPLALPTVMTYNPFDIEKAQQLIAERPVNTTVFGRDNSPTAYFLTDTVDGQVPAGHAFRFRRDQLGAVERQLVDTLPPETYRFHFANWSGPHGLTAGADVELNWPAERTDYVSPGASFTMAASAGFDENLPSYEFGWETTIPVTLSAGERRTSRVFGAPFGPELTEPPVSQQDGEPVPWAYRKGDRLTLSIPMFADSDPGNVSQFDASNKGSTVLLRGDEEIARRDDRPALGSFTLPSGPGRYRLVADASRPSSEALEPALSTRTRAEWTFRAGRGTDERRALPLLDTRFDLPLDAHNHAAAADPVTGGLTVAHQPGARSAPIDEVTVQVSYDDGTTWRAVPVDRDGDGWSVQIPAGGEPGGFASLRASASDRHGNSVTETVIRAYALR